jgi:hypothetical protein
MSNMSKSSRGCYTRQAVFRSLTSVLIIGAVCSCSTEAPPEAHRAQQAELLDRLLITEWDISPYSSQFVRISSPFDEQNQVEFLVTADLKFVTQRILSSQSVAVFVLDDAGIGGTVLNVGDKICGTPTGDAASGVLYRCNGEPVVIIEVTDD